MHRAAAFLDDESVPQIVGGMTHQRRGHDQVLLRMQLALQFLGQADERTSVFIAISLSEKKAETASPSGKRIPARVDDGPAVAGPERARNRAGTQGCLRGAVGAPPGVTTTSGANKGPFHRHRPMQCR